MTFEEELRRAFDTLTDRLRGELDRHARAALDELAQSARAERDEAIARAEAAARADADARVEASARDETAARAEAIAQAEAAVRAEAAAQSEEALRAHEAAWRAQSEQLAASSKTVEPRADTASIARLADGIRAMAAATSLQGVLDALVGAAGADGITARIWLLRNQRLAPWPIDSSGAQTEDVGLDEDRAITAAARNNSPALRNGVEQAFPLTLAGEVVAVFGISTAQGTTTDGRPQSAEELEILARYASRALEAITAFKTARAVVQAPAESGLRPSALSNEASSAEEHASAQRYAKLLVCEIKLYHEADVVDGRRDRDLVARLGGEIAHARVMYEQRVPRHVRQHADYFHDELVRTLANGDPSLLEIRT